MITNLSITSLSQGQIFGAKPSMEEFERQLEADGSIRIYNNLCAILAAFAGAARALKRTTGKASFVVHKHYPAH